MFGIFSEISESIGEFLWQVFAESGCYRFKSELTEPGEENNFLFLCCGRVWHLFVKLTDISVMPNSTALYGIRFVNIFHQEISSI